jgi:hypothetical protein
MPPSLSDSKLYHFFTHFRPKMGCTGPFWSGGVRVGLSMVGLAAMMFVALFGWGHTYFHWSDPHGRVQLALFTAFILGIICGYKTKG